MDESIELGQLIPESDRGLAVFAFINMGLIDALRNGTIGLDDAVPFFYNADHCLYVRKKLKNKIADRIMSHGVQLPDLFDALPPAESHREFLRELATIRDLCLRLLEDHRSVA